MAKATSVSTRMAADLVAAANDVAPAEHRSVTEQLNYWARVGMRVERSGSVATRAVLAAASGEAQFSGLTDLERQAAHALVDARMAERVASERFGSAARAAGRTTVSIDDDGNVIQIDPDGTRHQL